MENKKVGSVLVVGGGIAGIQASLDLANSGYKVYLLEETPAIGGTMAQLDKTFPTNDCAMCVMSPKLVECGRHLNIEIITNAELKKVAGNAGNFKVEVKKHPRYVDEDKCTGCAACTQHCPVTVALYPIEKDPIYLKPEDKAKVDSILEVLKDKKGNLMPILQGISSEFNYLPEKVLKYVSQELDISLTKIYQIATFYNAFSLQPKGKYTISVCFGTACYIKGANRILEAFERELGINMGNTTEDLLFGLDTISCFGCCGQAPVVTVNEDIYGHFKVTQVQKLLKKYREEENAKIEA